MDANPTESKRKLQSLRLALQEDRAQGLRLRGEDWLAWLTGGGGSPFFRDKPSATQILITKDRALILTDAMECARLRQEEIPAEFEVVSFPWGHPQKLEHFVEDVSAEGRLYSDDPRKNEEILPFDIQVLKRTMQPEEIERYRDLGQEAASALTDALLKAEPRMSEFELAGLGAKALWDRGLQPVLVLAAGAVRLNKFPHPPPTSEDLGHRAMLSVCARKRGLHVHLTRFISFQSLSSEEKDQMQNAAELEGIALFHTRIGRPLHEVSIEIREAAQEQSLQDESELCEIGGLTGYRPIEAFARAPIGQEPLVYLASGSVVNWNISLAGTHLNDTFLVTENGPEILTRDPRWPFFSYQKRERPAVMVKT